MNDKTLNTSLETLKNIFLGILIGIVFSNHAVCIEKDKMINILMQVTNNKQISSEVPKNLPIVDIK